MKLHLTVMEDLNALNLQDCFGDENGKQCALVAINILFLLDLGCNKFRSLSDCIHSRRSSLTNPEVNAFFKFQLKFISL